jgi:hypothetical protein
MQLEASFKATLFLGLKDDKQKSKVYCRFFHKAIKQSVHHQTAAAKYVYSAY